MKYLRNKGCCLPIKIEMKLRKDIIEYFLENTKVDFIYIKNFLSKVKNSFISQLDLMYNKKVNLRFLYGNQFITVMNHLEYGLEIDSIIKFIFNITDNNRKINEGYPIITKNVNDYINHYELYNINLLESISAYITSIFINNNKTLANHYEIMKNL